MGIAVSDFVDLRSGLFQVTVHRLGGGPSLVVAFPASPSDLDELAGPTRQVPAEPMPSAPVKEEPR
jgi:hypothetical protein